MGKLRLVTWNADGIRANRQELIQFLAAHDVDVALLQETHLDVGTRFQVPNYACYRTDRLAAPAPGRHAHPRRPSGGTAILVHRRIPHRQLVIPNLSMEATSIALQCVNTEVTVTSAYSTPGRPITADDLGAIFTPGTPSLLAGDLNAKRRAWGCNATNASGNLISRYLEANPDVTIVIPEEPTHVPYNPNHRPDKLDYALHAHLPVHTDMQVVPDLSSDHHPVILDLYDGNADALPPARRPRVDWAKYRDYMANHPLPLPDDIRTPQELDAHVTALTEAIQTATTASISAAPATPASRKLPAHLLQEVRLRRRLRRDWQASRCPRAKAAFNRQSMVVKRLLQDHSEEKWSDFLANCSTDDGSLWRLARSLRRDKPVNRPLHGQRGLVYSAEDRAEAFADSLEDQFSPHPDVVDLDFCDRVDDYLDSLDREEEDEEPIRPVTEEEVSAALARLKPRKAPGPDSIGSQPLRGLPQWAISHVTLAFNAAFKLRHYPTSWKFAKVILIPKPGKDPLFPDSHRPISLLPALSKVFERIILARIPEEFLEALRPEQFGCRRGHSTVLQVAKIINEAADSLLRRRPLTVALLDFCKAFDRVWLCGLIYKLAHSPLQRTLLFLIWSYLTDRTFAVFIGLVYSTTRPIAAGVPQGSVLGPLLFLWYVNDMPTSPHVSLSLYVDDALYRSRSASIRLSIVYLQRLLDLLEPWLERWRIKVNPTKSEAMCFTRKRIGQVNRHHLTLAGARIPWKTSVKYLGVTLDRTLTMTPHVTGRRCSPAPAPRPSSPS